MSIPAPPVQSDGSLAASFTFPASAAPGTYTVTATGSSSGDTATANLFLLPYFPSLGYTVKHGHYYVDGILCENETDTWSRSAA